MATATLTLLRSSVVKKAIMGLTGLGLSGFVLAHMTGNLLIFKGAQAYNTYGHQLTHNPAYPLIAIGLLALMGIHFVCGITLTWENKRARTQGYAVDAADQKAASLASRTMAGTGSILAVFIVLHLITFKYGTLYTITHDGVEMRDLHRLVIEVFQSPVYVAWYCFSLALLGFHLKHGFAAAFQSIGFGHPKWSAHIKCLAVVYALIVALGFISQPLYVYLVHR
ncbi:succinate dehydrogenase cytochrome b subunit [bacterium]|nr:succinate dehydrogenase cytochrome b subunit [bacterium]